MFYIIFEPPVTHREQAGVIIQDRAGRHVRDAICKVGINEPGELEFTMDIDHPGYNQLAVSAGTVTVRENDRTIFRGRIVADSKGFWRERTFECEGVLGYLNDAIIPPFTFPDDFLEDREYQEAAASGNVVEYFLRWLIATANGQTEYWQQLEVGTVTVRDPNNYIFRASSKHMTAMDVLGEKLHRSSLGGYIVPRYDGDVTYIDYLDELPESTGQKIEFGRNLLDLISKNDLRERATVIMPVGADGLTIESLPDGRVEGNLWKSGATVEDEAAVYDYGRITKVLELDDVTLPANLLIKAAAYFRTAGLASTVQVSALDLHMLGGGSFIVGTKVRVKSEPHGIDAAYDLTKITYDLNDPAATKIVLGWQGVTATGSIAAMMKE